MQKFEEQKFKIGELSGISAKNIEEHLKLYAGYVKHANLIQEKITGYMVDPEANTYVIGELQRRFGFEYNGMRNHEYYFRSLEGGAKPLSSDSAFRSEIEKQFSSFDGWLASFKILATTRGVGWAVLGWDRQLKQFVHVWIDEQHIGQLNGVDWILGLDMWEHAYVYDYPTSEKKKYVEAFFENLNWGSIEENFKKVS
ncbi:MAG TPA: Fe-Mn family superoxide dismutase [Candidatus Paceibacterota bacterium]|nr:Fe-Mn family superoxide dismutase [Candidatus Paceibacterota bacterium]